MLTATHHHLDEVENTESDGDSDICTDEAADDDVSDAFDDVHFRHLGDPVEAVSAA